MNDDHDNAADDKSALRAAVEEIGELTGLEILAVVPGQAQAPRFSGPGEAHAYVLEHDRRAKALNRLAMPTLRDIERGILVSRGEMRLMGGPGSKDELMNAILDAEFPDIAEARRIHYADPQQPPAIDRDAIQAGDSISWDSGCQVGYVRYTTAKGVHVELRGHHYLIRWHRVTAHHPQGQEEP